MAGGRGVAASWGRGLGKREAAAVAAGPIGRPVERMGRSRAGGWRRGAPAPKAKGVPGPG